MTLSNMVGNIDWARQQSNLSSAFRLFVLDRVRAQGSVGGTNQVEANAMNGGGIETRV